MDQSSCSDDLGRDGREDWSPREFVYQSMKVGKGGDKEYNLSEMLLVGPFVGVDAYCCHLSSSLI